MRRLALALVLTCAATAAWAQNSIRDRSGTITLGGQSQVVMSTTATNLIRKGCQIQNNSSADLWVNDVGGSAAATQPSWWLPAGAVYTCPPNGAADGNISIFGGTTGQAFTAREW